MAAVKALIVGLAGAVAVAIGIAVDPERTLAAYLVAWTTCVTIAAGALAVMLIGYAANARWPAAIRRISETITLGLLPLAVLAIPLLVFAADVWPWVEPSPETAAKRAYLSLAPFGVRTTIYLAILVISAEVFRAWSRRRDRVPSAALDRERRVGSALLPVLGLTLTFAAFDWLMSLQPAWFSSIFGLYVITGALSAGLAMTIVLARGRVPIRPDHFHAMGRLLHAFVILWVYIAFFQAFLIVIANRPDEVTFYIARSTDGWRWITAAVVILQFALPFPLLVPRRLKFRPRFVAGIGVMLLVAHYLDMWWLVLPVHGAPIPSWTDAAALCAVAGLTTAACAWRARGVPLLPSGDPHLAEGLAYTSPP